MSAAPSDLEKWRPALEPPPYVDRARSQAGGPFAEYDTLGRKQPRRIGLPDYLLMIARIDPGRVRRIPATAITEESTDDDGAYALVACPCGNHPIVRSGLVKCSGCERYYTNIAPGAVFVAYGAMSPPGRAGA